MEFYDIYFVIIEIAAVLLLFLLADYATKALSSKWKLCYIVPLVIAMFFAGLTGFEWSLLPAYIGAFVMLAGFLKDEKRTRQGVCLLTMVLVLGSLPVSLLNPGYRKPNYLKDFEKGFVELRTRYDLTEHKGIDWDEKYEEYRPKFAQVQKNHDEVENAIVWREFCNSFHDGHLGYSPDSSQVLDASLKRQLGNDYGLSLMTLENGKTVAIMVEEGSAPDIAGIHNGTVITAWNGENIDEILKNDDLPVLFSFPVKENEDFYKAMAVAGTGDYQVTISYMDDNGNECVVTAPKLGSYYERYKAAYEKIQEGKAGGNLSWDMVNDETACLRLTIMMYDSQSYNSCDHTEMQNELREKILELKEKGVKNLVFDLRSNGGGSPHFVMAIAGLVAPEGEHVLSYEGVWNGYEKCFEREPETGQYVRGLPITYEGENLWENGNIIVLVNNDTISAGDIMTSIMGDYENVTVMGFTSTNCSAQAVSQIEMEAGSLSFSAIPNLDENGDIVIDTGTDRKATVPLDVKIPFDERAVDEIFNKGGDYVMEYALDYIKK